MINDGVCSMSHVLIEICCGSADDVIEAAKGGADRVELNANLFQGGLTPTLGALLVAKQRAKVPVMVMIRPREGGFCYTKTEFDVALADAEMLLQAGADGLVFGFLHEDGRVDAGRTREMIRLAAGKPCVFHRALDVTPDWRQALDTLIDLGITRVLTSGQESSALLGAETIAEMMRFADGAIEILPGAGITLRNAQRVIDATGCTQVHLSSRKQLTDRSVCNNRSIQFGGALYPPEDAYGMTDWEQVAALKKALK